MTVKSIALDAFGTLCEISRPRRPYAALARLTAEPHEFLKSVLTRSLSEADLRRLVGPRADDVAFARFSRDLCREIAFIGLFEDTIPALRELRQRGLRIAVVSNLASPYVDSLRRLLQDSVDGFVLSCEVGLAKPDPRIFELACAEMGSSPGTTLMVGDSLKSDVRGAADAGLKALQIERRKSTGLNSLLELGHFLDADI
ncbi:MAG: HAD family hydrolase [Acidobacteriota bacterium]